MQVKIEASYSTSERYSASQDFYELHKLIDLAMDNVYLGTAESATFTIRDSNERSIGYITVTDD